MIDVIMDAKAWLETMLHVDRDSLHIHFALLLMFGCALATRRPLSHWLPWTAVLLAALIGEAVDYTVQPRPYEWFMLARRDVIATMLWPSLIALLARWPRLRLR